MAQYGRSFFGASYYGINGVFVGQFVSDISGFEAPLNNTAPSDGTLSFNIETKMATATYLYNDSIFRYQGLWTDHSLFNRSLDPNFKVNMMLSCSDFTLNFRRITHGALVDISVKKQAGGVIESTETRTINTSISSSTSFTNLPFGEYIVDISRNQSSPPTSVFEFRNISAITTDVSLEVRSTLSDIASNPEWTSWNLVPLTRTYDPISAIHSFAGKTANIGGSLGYQFRLILASADNLTTPEVIKHHIFTTSNEEYSPSGRWKTIIDLGTSVESITTLNYEADIPEGTTLDIQTRTTSDPGIENNRDINVSWDAWSPPYSQSARRLLLDIRNSASLRSGYIITPMIHPQNLTNWISYIPDWFIVSEDPVSGEVNNNSGIRVSFLDSNLSIIRINGRDQSYYFDRVTRGMEYGISQITIPCRIRIELIRELGFSTPAIDNIKKIARAEYIETRKFGEGSIESYGSSVFSNNTGIDFVYTDGLPRKNRASISSFNFTFPMIDTLNGQIQLKDPEYIISNINMPGYSSDTLKLYWHSEKDKENKSSRVRLSDTTPDDYVMVEVKEDGTRVKKYKQYGSGITMKLDSVNKTNYDRYSFTNIFYPTLPRDRRFAYFLLNGFTDSHTVNEHVDIRWGAENTPAISTRRNLTYSLQEPIFVSIIMASQGGFVQWKSEERILEATVNPNSPSLPRTTRITLDSTHELPEIPADAIIDANPYITEIVDGSVESEGQIRENSRINMFVDNSLNKYKLVTEDKVSIIKSNGSQDFIPRSRTTTILGIYDSTDMFSPNYVQGLHFSLINGNRIDWSIGIDNPDLSVPEADSVIYISYIYEKIDEITIEATSNYNKNVYDAINIYRTNAIRKEGRCSYGSDYISEKYDVDLLWQDIPPSVDRKTLSLKAVLQSNDFVNIYIKDEKVIGTLAGLNVKTNWHPHIKQGFYYIGDQSYYMFSSPYILEYGKETVPIAQNVAYVDGVVGQGILLQESTRNLIKNNRLRLSTEQSRMFVDTFER